MASYTAKITSKTITNGILSDIPNIAVAPTAIMKPQRSITYHSGYLTRNMRRTKASIRAKLKAKTVFKKTSNNG